MDNLQKVLIFKKKCIFLIFFNSEGHLFYFLYPPFAYYGKPTYNDVPVFTNFFIEPIQDDLHSRVQPLRGGTHR